MRPHKENYIYGLFYYIHPFYSYNALKNIKVQRRLDVYKRQDKHFEEAACGTCMSEMLITYVVHTEQQRRY